MNTCKHGTPVEDCCPDCITDKVEASSGNSELLNCEETKQEPVGEIYAGGPGPMEVRFFENTECGTTLPHGTKLYKHSTPAMEDKRDAERYRWLVENAVIETDKWKHDGNDPSSTKHPLDRAIDTAMENGKENPDDEYGREAYYDDQRKERGWE